MKPKRATPERKWPLEKLRFLDVFRIQCGWIEEPRGSSVLQTIRTWEEFREAWEENKESFLELCEEPPSRYRCSHRICCKPGTRPGAWWQIDRRMDWRPSEKQEELEYLKQHGLLSEKEKRLLEPKNQEPEVVPFGRRYEVQALEEDDEEDEGKKVG
jgi:hypothetical protein